MKSLNIYIKFIHTNDSKGEIMKKIIPILSILSAGIMLTGCANSPVKVNSNDLLNSINNFQTTVDNYTKNGSESLTKIALNKYELLVSSPINARLMNSNDSKNQSQNKSIIERTNDISNDNKIKEIANENVNNTNNNTNKNQIDIKENNELSATDTNEKLIIENQNNLNHNKDIVQNDITISPIQNDSNEKSKTLQNMSENREIRKQRIIDVESEILDKKDNINLMNVQEENNSNNDSIIDTSDLNETDINEDDVTKENSGEDTDNDSSQISTLYSLSSDIEDSCDEFCELKEEIVDAIIETQNLISKLQLKEIELTAEQKIFLSEQSEQLKNLGRRLSAVTRELSLSLADISTFTQKNVNDIDSLSLKYLIVLDNLINGNELLENGLQSLNMINSLFDINSNIEPNNRGRILYGFRRNKELPIIKDYLIKEDGQIVENNSSNSNEDKEENKINSDEESNSTTQMNSKNPDTLINDNIQNPNNVDDLNTIQNAQTTRNSKLNNVDTYNNRHFNSNIDTYGNNFKNTDTFFNTALLDNEFLYGRSGYPYANNYMYNNPYGMNYYNQNNVLNPNVNNANNQNNATDSVNNGNATHNSAQQESEKTNEKFNKLQKNIDTYKDANTPSLKSKFNKFKQSVSNFFAKFSVPKHKGQYENPIYKYNNVDSKNNESKQP